MLQKFIALFFLLGVISTTLYAQEHSISGKITDATTGETLFGVNVIIPELNRGTVTNAYGFYSLSVPDGPHAISFSYLGYEIINKSVDISENQTINIALEEVSEQLEQVVLSSVGKKARDKIKTPQMSVTKLSATTIKNAPVVLGEVDILKTITLLPGVTNAGEGSSGFNVRGGAADQNLVLLDEATIYNTSHLFGFFSVFNADAIKDVTLYKGGIPAKYGGRVASVLDVRQKDGNNKEFHMSGGIGFISSRLMAEGPLKKEKGSFLIAGRTSYVNPILKLANVDSRLSFYDLNTKLSYELNENNKIYVSGYFGKDAFSIGDVLSSTYGNTSLNLRWNHLFSKKLFSNLSLIYSKYDYTLGFESAGFEWISDINTFDLKYDFDYFINSDFTLNFGANVKTYLFNPGEVVPKTEESTYNAEKLDKKRALEPVAYIEAEHHVSEKLTLRYGVRLSTFLRQGGQTLNTYENDRPVIYNADFDIYESAEPTGTEVFTKGSTIKTFVGFEPRASASYMLNEQTSIKGSYQRVYQYLHLISNTNAPTPLDIWTPSGSFIKPQESDQYAIGFFRNFKDETYTLEVESYYKTVANRLDYIDGADLIATNTIETEVLAGESRAYGLEFSLKKNKGRFKGWFSYTLSKSEQRVEGRTPLETGINNGEWYNTPYDRTHDFSLTGSYQLNDRWNLSANFLYQTGRPTNYPSGQYQFDGITVPVFTTRNAERLPDFHRLDLSATYTPRKNKNRKWQSQWVFGVYNAYGRKNAASITFREIESNNPDINLGNEAVKTNIFGIIPAVTYNFKF
jgi:hypothetical protein